jgi:hypothetical protein
VPCFDLTQPVLGDLVLEDLAGQVADRLLAF